jgi:hypothetical protein
MKTMKWMVVALVLAGTTLLIPSCGKYEEGPKFTLLTKKMRLVGDWDAKEYVYDNGTTVSESSDDVLTFEKDGTARYTLGAFSFSGTWEFASDKEKVRVVYSGTPEELNILRLTNKELWLREDGDNYYIRYEAK